uniref:Uncharacterized protein n=1 Tax=Oryza nivara TaxID=4536 RepID=A0A0E0G1H5_ORYNI
MKLTNELRIITAGKSLTVKYLAAYSWCQLPCHAVVVQVNLLQPLELPNGIRDVATEHIESKIKDNQIPELDHACTIKNSL